MEAGELRTLDDIPAGQMAARHLTDTQVIFIVKSAIELEIEYVVIPHNVV